MENNNICKEFGLNILMDKEQIILCQDLHYNML